MKRKIKYLSFLVSLAIAGNAMAYNEHFGEKSGNKPGGNTGVSNTKGASCAPASSRLTMKFNDVSAQLESGGLLFLDRQNGVATYKVPKDGNVAAIYAGSLWMGGVDVNGQLKLAAVIFRQEGNDFWAGPLTVIPGTGNYDPSVPQGDSTVRDHGEGNIQAIRCLYYDKIYTIRKAEVIAFVNWWECEGSGGAIEAPEYCEGADFPIPNSEILNRIYAWPGNGNQEEFLEDDFLAPFYDRDLGSGADGIYDPLQQGDYPWYDDILGRDDVQCGKDRRVTLFGDETNWWVFNDRGNIHTETGGDAIGMEIRAQAFAFATDDEINRMTFYNYELINRGSQTLDSTFFAQYIDADLGGHLDDYVGCDVTRGLGYCYNGELIDQPTSNSVGYGANPPAIGVDFFEGPYQDADNMDNPLVTTGPAGSRTSTAIAAGGIVYPGLGIGYGDTIADNERFGMRRFCYFVGQGTSNPALSDPSAATQFYNYMKGNWRYGDEMYYGGTGHSTGGGTNIPADYMFPDDSDTLNWGTQGTATPYDWSEFEPTGQGSSANPPGDRRFVQAAGPFVLRPGAVNNITVGIVFARSAEGDVLASVRALKRADTKAQALFDNCFRILEPPHAPLLNIQEMENQLILTIDNPAGSNNFKEQYIEEDKINILPEFTDRFYRFEGYQVFQLKNATSTIADLGDFTKARLVAQCDIENGVTRLVNFEFDEELGFSYPVEKVDGEDKGIKHSFRVTEDLFASGVRTLVNHKTYYYVAVAYGYNNYKKYDPNDALSLDGQKMPYLRSRINADGSAISPTLGVPHNPAVELGGTMYPASYGQTPRITRVDGTGNGGRALTLTSASENNIVANGFMQKPQYEYDGGPINVKVIDPLNLKGGYYELKFRDYTSGDLDDNAIDTASWIAYRYEGGVIVDSVTSDVTIQQGNEQLVPQWGVSLEIKQDFYKLEGENTSDDQTFGDVIESSVLYSDSTKKWLSFVQDDDQYYPTNWVRDGSYDAPTEDCNTDLGLQNPCYYKDETGLVPDGMFSTIIGGGVAPHRLTGFQGPFMPLAYPYTGYNLARQQARLSYAPSVDIVLTSDKSKWTRCVVVELGFDAALNVNGTQRGKLRSSPSVDKNGNPDGTGTGMGWFPGYAIDLESGARLHMAFGENSFLGGHNGADMVWNPTSTGIDDNGIPVFGGQHAIWVFGYQIPGTNSPAYDGVNNWVYDQYQDGSNQAYGRIVRSLMWVANVYKAAGHANLESEARMRIRIAHEYFDLNASGENGGKPMYSWSMDDILSTTGSSDVLSEMLDKINIVPNPYYAYAEYERNRIDTRVKIVNLPDQCTVKIFTSGGKLVRTYKKDNQVTSIDWDLKNVKGIPIASGVYLIHVDVPGVGEKIVKFFAGMRQVDLQNI